MQRVTNKKKKNSLALDQNRRVPQTLPLLLLRGQNNWDDVGTAVRLGGAVLVGPAETMEQRAYAFLCSVLPLAERSGTPFLRLVLRLQPPLEDGKKAKKKQFRDLVERFRQEFGECGLQVVVATTKNSKLPGGWKVVRSVYRRPQKKTQTEEPNSSENCSWVVASWSRHDRSAEMEKVYQGLQSRMQRYIQRDVPGYLGRRSVRGGKEALSLTFFRDRAALEMWRTHPAHLRTKRASVALGLYTDYEICVCRMDRRYGFTSETDTAERHDL